MVESRLATPRPDQSWLNRVGAPWQDRAEWLSPRKATAPPLQQVSGSRDPRARTVGRPPWWPYAASLPRPRLQWRDRTGFSPVSLSAPPIFWESLTAEAPSLLSKLYHPLAPYTIVASAAYSRFFGHDGVGRYVGWARLAQARRPRRPRFEPSASRPHMHDSLSPRVPVGPGVVPPRRPVGHNVVRLRADGTILVSPDIGRSVERVEVRSVSTRATCHAG